MSTLATTRSGGPRVLILSSDIGEGHDLPARVLAAELEAERPDCEVTVKDSLETAGRFLHWLGHSAAQIIYGPLRRLFDLEYWLVSSFPPTRWLAQTMIYAISSRGLLRLVAQMRPDIVVSTYPGASDVLGRARVRGRLDVPTCSAITDLAGLRYWAHPGIDLHLVTHPESVEEVRRIAGAEARVHTVLGLTSREFLEPRDALEARRSLGLPEQGKLVVVSGGGWAVGDLEGAVETSLAVDGAFVVCLCGRADHVREQMERRFGGEPRVRVVGFTERMNDLLAAADALLHSTAGLTVLEAHMRGCPAISYGWGIAHIRANNRAFERFGLARVARTRGELAEALRHALERRKPPDRSFADLPSAASLVLAELPARV